MSKHHDASASACEQMPQALLYAEDRGEYAARSSEHGTRSGEPEPRPVTTGRKIQKQDNGEPSARLAHIDWLSLTLKPPTEHLEGWLHPFLLSVFQIPPESYVRKPTGWMGYTTRVELGEFGMIAFGGKSQRGTVYLALNAKGCIRIDDWNAVRLWCEVYNARLTRVDLAHDDIDAKHVDVDRAALWYLDGEFNSGGRQPAVSVAGDWLTLKSGRTLYIGVRGSGKYCRVYEKGKQLGDKTSRWCRVEVECGSQSRTIPFDVLTRPGAYLAGAYPCLSFLSEEQSKIKTSRKATEITYAQLVRCLRTQYGPALRVMTEVEGGDACAVLAQLMRPGTPKRLASIPVPRGESSEGDTR